MTTTIHPHEGSLPLESALQIRPPTFLDRFLDTFTALRHRNFRLMWGGQFISLIGTWMESTGQAWLVLQITHNAWALGMVGALQFLPMMCFALFGGVIADRLPKRRVLLYTQSIAMMIAFTLWLLVITGNIQLWHIYVLAGTLGLVNSLDTPTRQAFVVETVGRAALPNAIALNSSVFNMARIVGPAIAGLLIAWLGNTLLFFFNTLSFIPVIICLALINTNLLHKAPARPKQNPFLSIQEGFKYIARTPVLILLLTIVGLISLIGINFNVALPLFAENALHEDAAGFGLLSSCFGIGSFIAAIWLAWGNNKPTIKKFLLACIGFSALEVFFGFSNSFVFAGIFIALIGFAQITLAATANTAIQTVAPDHLRGRIMSVYMLVFAGSVPPGNLMMGALASMTGIAPALSITGSICLVIALIGWFIRKPAIESLKRETAIE